jgi:site-specific recombinase XerD
MRLKRSARWESMNKSNTDLTVLISFFETHNRTEGKSPRTVEWYNQVLGLLYRWLQEQDMPTTLGFMNEMVIRQFILHLQGRPGTKGKTMSSHSIYNRVNALRSFFGWLHQKGYTPEHLLQGLKQPKTTEVIIEPLADEEVEKILSKIDPNTALGARNTALVWLMLDTGLRLSEVASLAESNVHLDDQYLKVMGKGSKERMVAFGVGCKRVLLHYFHYFRPQPAQEEIDTFFYP